LSINKVLQDKYYKIMDINQLFSIIGEKKLYTEETISEAQKLIDRFPYFSTGHMLLLRAMRDTKSAKFDNQLNISGGFIADKKRLYQFINTAKAEIKTEESGYKLVSQEINQNVVGTPKDKSPETKTEISQTEKKAELGNNKEQTGPQKEIEFEISRTKKEPKVRVQKTKMSVKGIYDSELERKIHENSKKRHHGIVNDFFVDPTKKVTIIDETADALNLLQETELSKEKKSTIDKNESLLEKKNQRKEKIESNVFEEIVSVEKEEIQKKEEPVVIDEIKHDKQNKLVVEEIKPIIKEKEPIEKKKTLNSGGDLNTGGKTVSGNSRKKQSDVMNDIFAKIKAIKKELNVNAGEKEKAADISKTNKTIEPKILNQEEDKKKKVAGNTISKKKLTDIKAIKDQINEKISLKKEELLTTNDLIVQQQKKKIEEKEDNPEEQKKLKEESLFVNQEEPEEIVNHIEKTNVEVTGEEKTIVEEKEELPVNLKNEEVVIEKEDVSVTNLKKEETIIEEETKLKTEKDEIIIVEDEKTPVDTQKEEQIVVDEKDISDETEKKLEKKEEKPEVEEESAADALLKRIALKKQKKKEKELEEANMANEKKSETEPVIESSLEKNDEVETKTEQIIEKAIVEKEEPETRIEATKAGQLSENEVDSYKVEKELLVIDDKVHETKIEKENVDIPKTRKSKKLIDDFINKSDSLERLGSKAPSIKGDMSTASFEEKEEFSTEAMADLYIQQKYYDKAINIYNKLILKFPQKKTYFAIQIKRVQSLIKNK